MAKSDKERLNRVLTEVLEEGLSAERIAELEDLLLDNPELQAYYTDALKLNTLMRYELSGGLQKAPPLVDSLQVDTTTLIQPMSSTEVIQNESTRAKSNSGRRWNSFTLWATALAVSLLAAVAVLKVVVDYGAGDNTSGDTLVAKEDIEQSHVTTPATTCLYVRDAQQLATLSRITKTEMITRVVLPGSLSESPGPGSEHRLVGGNAWIDRSPGGSERGYVVELSPGYRMDVGIDADAGNQNALGIVELDSQGRMTGDTFSFNNMPTESDQSWRHYGNIGAITVENRSNHSRYFLFAGSHVDLGNPGEGWKQSDYKLLHESSDFLVLGWDDSGYLGESPDQTTQDQDYNDVCSVLHFAPVLSKTSGDEGEILYVPALSTDLQVFTGPEPGHPFDVKPGQNLMLMVSDSSRIPSTALFVDQDSQEIVWRDDAYGKESLPVDSPNETSTRGIYVIKNNSSTVKRFAIHAGHFDEANKWVEMPFRLNGEDEHWECIGFEDSLNGPMGNDWNDIQIHARWFED